MFDVMGTDDQFSPEGNEEMEVTQEEEMEQDTDGTDGEEGDGTETETSQEGEDSDGGEQTSKPNEKFAGMYDTVDQLVNAYKSLQTAYQSEKAKNKKSLDSVLGGGEQTQAQAQQSQVPTGISTIPEGIDPALLAKAYEQNPAGTISLLTQYQIQQALKPVMEIMQKNNTIGEIAKIRTQYGDFQQYEGAVADILEQNPQLKSLPNRLEVAYFMAKGQGVQAVADKALQNGIKQGQQTANAKQKVVPGGKGTGSKSQAPKSNADAIVDGIMSFAGKGIF